MAGKVTDSEKKRQESTDRSTRSKIQKSESNRKKGPFQLKTEQTVWDLPIRILPTLPSLAESGIAEGQITKTI